MTYRAPIVAVDFDGVIVENRFPDIGPIRDEVWQALRRWKQRGCWIVIWTCRSGEHLEAMRCWLDEHGVPYDAINENVPALGFETGRKIYADVYLDDRAANSLEVAEERLFGQSANGESAGMTGPTPAAPQRAVPPSEPKFVLGMIAAEYKAAVASHPPMASAHEGYAVLLEELDELWAEVKKPEGRRNPWAMMREAVQVAAMAVRFIEDVCLKQLGAERNEIAPEQIRREAAAHGLPGVNA